MHPAKNTRAPIGTSQKPPRTTCKVCGCSIFQSDETGWVVSPNPGLAHQVCAEEVPPRPS